MVSQQHALMYTISQYSWYTCTCTTQLGVKHQPIDLFKKERSTGYGGQIKYTTLP